MRVWLLPDPHFQHTKLTGGMGRPANFTERVARGWDRSVAPLDVIYVLGDISVGEDREVHERHVRIRPGRKVLIKGNHDKRSDAWYYAHGWDFVAEQVLLNRMGRRILLSHIPQPDLGHFDLNIHGHLHNTDRRRFEPEMSKILTRDKHFLLALEIHGYAPILLDAVLKGRIREI
jgi:calcineurin-like phosphoesterase family protein